MKPLVKLKKGQFEFYRNSSFFSKRVRVALYAAILFHALFFTIFRIRFPQPESAMATQTVTRVTIQTHKKTDLVQRSKIRPELTPKVSWIFDDKIVQTLPLKMEVPHLVNSDDDETLPSQTLFSLQGDLSLLELEEEQFPLSTLVTSPVKVELLVNRESGRVLWADSENLSDETLLEIAKGVRFKKTDQSGWLFGTLELLP